MRLKVSFETSESGAAFWYSYVAMRGKRAGALILCSFYTIFSIAVFNLQFDSLKTKQPGWKTWTSGFSEYQAAR
jgi:hypothetical protein